MLYLYNLLYFILLMILYNFYIGEMYAYMGFEKVFSNSNFFLSGLIILIFIFLGKKNKKKIFFFLYFIIMILNFIPSLVYFIFSSNCFTCINYGIFLIILCFIEKINLKVLIETKKNIINLNKYLILFLVFIMPVYIIQYHPYFNFKNLLLKDIYKTRLIFREIPVKILPYFNSPISRVVAPILLIDGIKKKNFLLIIISILSILIVFLAGAVKSIFLGIICVVLFYKGDVFCKIKKGYLFFLSLILSALLIKKIFDNKILIDLLRRFLFTSLKLDSLYYNYFKKNYTFFSHIFYKEKFSNMSVTAFFGQKVMKEPNLNANIGVLTDGYISLGILGVILFSFIIMITLYYFYLMNFKEEYFGVLFLYIYYFNTSLLTTLFLTHGYMALLIVTFLKKTKRGENVSNKKYET